MQRLCFIWGGHRTNTVGYRYSSPKIKRWKERGESSDGFLKWHLFNQCLCVCTCAHCSKNTWTVRIWPLSHPCSRKSIRRLGTGFTLTHEVCVTCMRLCVNKSFGHKHLSHVILDGEGQNLCYNVMFPVLWYNVARATLISTAILFHSNLLSSD